MRWSYSRRPSGDVYRVEATISNTGFLPTELAVRRQAGRAHAVVATISVPSGDILTEDADSKIEYINGNDEETTSWIVRGERGSEVELSVSHPKAGRHHVSVSLGSN